jgi:hypothetical protein
VVINLFQNLSERNAVNKSLSNVLILSGTLKEQTSIKTPTLTIACDDSICVYNYGYIYEFDRYYFITDIKSIRQNLWEVSFICDVLMSFKNDILQCPCIIDHTEEHEISNYLQSGVWTNLVKDKTDIINFSGDSLLDSGEYILMTAGG